MSRGKRDKASIKAPKVLELSDELGTTLHLKDIDDFPKYYTGKVMVELEHGGWISDCIKHIDIYLRFGMELWLQDGFIHRDEDLPAFIGPNQEELWWCQHGQRHRDGDKPALITTPGAKNWHQEVFVHSLAKNKSDISWGDGTQQWFCHNRRHRLTGPASISSTGAKEYWIHNTRLTKKEWIQRVENIRAVENIYRLAELKISPGPRRRNSPLAS